MSLTRRYFAPVALPADPEFSVVCDAVVDVNEDGRIGYCGPAAEAPPIVDASKPGCPASSWRV